MKSLAAKAGEKKLIPTVFQAPEKLNVLEVYVNHQAFTNCYWLLLKPSGFYKSVSN